MCEKSKAEQKILQNNFKCIDECVNKFGENTSENLASFKQTKNLLVKKSSEAFINNLVKFLIILVHKKEFCYFKII